MGILEPHHVRGGPLIVTFLLLFLRRETPTHQNAPLLPARTPGTGEPTHYPPIDQRMESDISAHRLGCRTSFEINRTFRTPKSETLQRAPRTPVSRGAASRTHHSSPLGCCALTGVSSASMSFRLRVRQPGTLLLASRGHLPSPGARHGRDSSHVPLGTGGRTNVSRACPTITTAAARQTPMTSRRHANPPPQTQMRGFARDYKRVRINVPTDRSPPDSLPDYSHSLGQPCKETREPSKMVVSYSRHHAAPDTGVVANAALAKDSFLLTRTTCLMIHHQSTAHKYRQ